MPVVSIPDTFRNLIAGRDADPQLPGGISGEDWLRWLPGAVADHLAEWQVTIDGAAGHGECAVVFPVRRAGEQLVLKLTWPHVEATQEHLALRAWNGRGAVRLVAADPTAFVLLLERLDGDRDLTMVPWLDACEVIGDLFGQLDRPAVPQLPQLSAQAGRWREQLTGGDAAMPRRLLVQAASTLDDLLVDDVDGRLVHTDLHYANVLAGRRDDWLAIDPKPVSGEWAFAVAPAVWNRADDAAQATSLRAHLRFRADVITDAAGLDQDRVRAWTFVRLVLNAWWAREYGAAAAEFRSRMIGYAKAFAD